MADVFGDIEGIGLDLVDVALMRDLIEDGGRDFIDAYWTDTEQSNSRNDPERLAGRWAAKEAVMKCLGAGVGEIDPIDIEIITLTSGAPRVTLRARAAEIAQEQGLRDCLVTITHEDGWAAAIAVGQRQKDTSQSSPSLDGPLAAGDRNV